MRNAEISDFEVEDGVTISDHVKLDPLQIDLDCFISDAPANYLGIRAISDFAAGAVNALIPGRFGDDSDVPNAESKSPLDAWNYLSDVWQARDLIVVVTSIEIYRNMILTTLSAPKTAATGKSLEFKASMREVRVLESATLEFPAFKIKSKAAKNRATSKVQKGKNTGAVATAAKAPRPESALHAWFGSA